MQRPSNLSLAHQLAVLRELASRGMTVRAPRYRSAAYVRLQATCRAALAFVPIADSQPHQSTSRVA